MAGGPSTPALAAAVDRAGGLGFLAAGYLTAEGMRQDISTTRAQIDDFGVNVLPSACPEIHHLTSPLRAHGREVGDPDLVNLWAGQAHRLSEALPADAPTGAGRP